MSEKCLFIVTTRGLGDFYVIAGSFDQAAEVVRAELDAQDYGYFNDRLVTTVKFVCKQHFSSGKRFFSGDREENHLIVWGDGKESED